MSDEIDRLSDSDEQLLAELEAEYERDGPVAFDLLRERDFMAFVRIVAAVMPKEFNKALDDLLLGKRLTPSEIRERLRQAQFSH